MRRYREPLVRRAREVPRAELQLLAGALVASVAVVLVYVLTTRSHALAGDEAQYNDYGVFFTQGKLWWSTAITGTPHASAWKAPGYPAWVGLWYWLLGDSALRVEIVQAFLAPITVALTWALARRLLGPPAAIAAAWVVALFPLAWEYYGLLFPEALAVPLTIALLALVLGRRPTAPLVVGAGLLLGINLLVRPTAFFLLAGIAAAWIVAVGWRRGIALSVAAAAIAALVVLPWTIRNAVVLDAFIPISVQDAAAYGTFNADAANDPDDPYAWRALPRGVEEITNPPRPLTEAELRSKGQDVALDYIEDHPASVPKAIFWNGITRFWDLRPPGDALDEVAFQGRSKPVRAIGLGIYYVLLVAALAGLWRMRRRTEIVAPVLAMAVFATLAFTIVAATRYRAPLEPLIAILACSLLAARGRPVAPRDGGIARAA